jgi:hypothetical protein
LNGAGYKIDVSDNRRNRPLHLRERIDNCFPSSSFGNFFCIVLRDKIVARFGFPSVILRFLQNMLPPKSEGNTAKELIDHGQNMATMASLYFSLMNRRISGGRRIEARLYYFLKIFPGDRGVFK